MVTVIIASKNEGKVREFHSLFNNPNVKFISLNDMGFDEDIIEDGKTFSENAIIKAKYVAKKYHMIAISDDSGLCVDSLGGAPGIYSARYAKTRLDEDNNALLIKNLKGIENRNAHYSCAICVCMPNLEYKVVEARCDGIIIDEARGKNGFGYDPYFYIEEFKKTFAEVDLETKNKISHRARAIRAMKELLNEDFSFK